MRRDACHLIDESSIDGYDHSPGMQQGQRLYRAQALDLAMRCAQAAVIARAGSAMPIDTPAEGRLREGAFLLMQVQTAPSRQASLQLLRGGSGRKRADEGSR